MKFIAAIILAGAYTLSAQTAKSATPPVITDAQKLAYFKAQAEYQSAAQQAQSATQIAQEKNRVLQAAGEVIVTACGKDFTATMDASGMPSCVAKPEAPKK